MSRRYWYYYSGNGADNDAANYNLGSNEPKDICFGGRTSCAVYSKPSGANNNKPQALSSNLQSYIINSKALTTPYPNLPNYAFAYSRPSI